MTRYSSWADHCIPWHNQIQLLSRLLYLDTIRYCSWADYCIPWHDQIQLLSRLLYTLTWPDTVPEQTTVYLNITRYSSWADYCTLTRPDTAPEQTTVYLDTTRYSSWADYCTPWHDQIQLLSRLLYTFTQPDTAPQQTTVYHDMTRYSSWADYCIPWHDQIQLLSRLLLGECEIVKYGFHRIQSLAPSPYPLKIVPGIQCIFNFTENTKYYELYFLFGYGNLKNIQCSPE